MFLMVRDSLHRRNKYEAKTDGSVSEKRTDAYRTRQVTLHTEAQEKLVPREIQAKTGILEPAGVPVNEMPFYLNAMREFCRCCDNFTAQTRFNECYNIYLTWVQKGLENDLVVALGIMCGCNLEMYYY